MWEPASKPDAFAKRGRQTLAGCRPALYAPRAVNLAAHQRRLLEDLAARRDPHERLTWLVARADAWPRLPVTELTDATRVPGCLSQLWMVGRLREGRCEFRCDSDSRIVRAVAGLVCEFFSGLGPEEVSTSDARPLADAGLDRLLAANRRNAISRARERIRELAREFAIEARVAPDREGTRATGVPVLPAP